VFVGLFRDNSKLHASILTKLGLKVQVVTISSWLNFGRPAPREGGLRRGENFWLRLTTASAQCLRLSLSAFFTSKRSHKMPKYISAIQPNPGVNPIHVHYFMKWGTNERGTLGKSPQAV